jgi:ankyrin repeat protein
LFFASRGQLALADRPEVTEQLETCLSGGQVALADRPDAVEILIDEGALVDYEMSNGSTALIEACSLGLVRIGQVLLRRGARPDYETRVGYTALMRAAINGHVGVRHAIHQNQLNVPSMCLYGP